MWSVNRRIIVYSPIAVIILLIYLAVRLTNNRDAHGLLKANPLPPIRDDTLVWPPKLENAICRPRIYVYDIPSELQVSKQVQDTVCASSNYKSELLLYESLTNPSSRFSHLYLTKDPTTADFFYIPFFGACWLSKCWSENDWKFEQRCGVDELYVIPFMNHIIQSYPYWNHTGGRNHIMVHPMDGTFIYYTNSNHLFQPAIFLTTVGDKRTKHTSYHRRHRDIIIPSATGLLHRARVDPQDYVSSQGHPLARVTAHHTRDILVLFRGCCPDVKPEDVYSAGVRSLFYTRFRHLPGWDIAESSPDDEYARRLARARYGLAPMGWTLDTTRLWEYLAFGVVPVIIADGIIEPFEDDVDWNSFVVWVRREDAHILDEVLAEITNEEYERKRKRVWEEGRRVGLERDAWHFIARELCRIGEIDRPEKLPL